MQHCYKIIKGCIDCKLEAEGSGGSRTKKNFKGGKRMLLRGPSAEEIKKAHDQARQAARNQARQIKVVAVVKDQDNLPVLINTNMAQVVKIIEDVDIVYYRPLK